MSAAPTHAEKWTCDGCGVSISRIDGEPLRLPDAWEESAEGSFCLICRRERAAEAALMAAPGAPTIGTRAKLRRTALIEFEVSRTPDHTDGTIARACRTSTAVVTQARRRLRLPDPAPPTERGSAKGRVAAGR
jgi:hypothetical protein